MEFQIAMLLKPHLCSFCRSLIGERYRNCVLAYHSYETLEEMSTILKQIKTDYDGVITSGLIPHSLVLSMIRDEEISASFFGFDVENMYRIILEQSIQRKNFSLSRIGIDFIPESEDTAQVIGANRMPELVCEFEKWLRAIPPQELSEKERGIAKSYLERYNRGEIDFIVTYFYSTVIEMHRHGIDCFYLYPNEREIEHTFEDIEKSILLRRATLPAVVRLDLRPGREDNTSILERKMLVLEHTMQAMLSNMGEGIALNRRNYAVELYTDSHALKRLTNGYKSCFFYEGVMEKCDFKGTVGYGIAGDFYHARLNAMDASNYASNFQSYDKKSVLIDANEKMIHLGQEDTDPTPVVSPDGLRNMAQAVRLSPETLLRIIEVLRAEETDEITSSELIGRLGVSLRTANRFLSHLQQGGLAKIVGYRSSVGKGRPNAIYQIGLPEETR